MVPAVQEQMLTNDQEQERNQRDAASCRSHSRPNGRASEIRSAPRLSLHGRTSLNVHFFLGATVTGIALERFDALTRDNRNHENCGYSRFPRLYPLPPDSKRKKTRICTKLAPAQRS